MRRIRIAVTVLAIPVCASAENYVPLDTSHFSEGMITYLKRDTTTKKYIKTVNGVECIDVDGPTAFNLTYHVNDTKGLRLFKNLTTINANGIANYCKHFDARGLTKLTTLTFVTNAGPGNSTAGSNDKVKLSTILVDSTNITSLGLPQNINLRHVSCSHCPNLQTVYLQECDLMGLDLSDSPNLTNVIVYGNPRLSVLRLPQSAPKLTQIHACHTNLQELIVPEDMANGLAGDRIISLNFDYTQVKKAVMPVYDAARGLKKPYVKSYLYGDGALLSLNSSQFDQASNGSWSSGTRSNTTRVGHVNSFTIFDNDEKLVNDRNMTTSATGFTPGAGTFDGHVFTFAEGKTSVTYTVSSTTQRNLKTTSIKCTVNRTLEAPDIYLEFDDNNVTLDKLYAKYMGEGVVESFDADGKPKYRRIPLNYQGNNVYTLTPKCLMGNFHFVVVGSDGKEEILGANDADLSELLPEWENGHAFLDCRSTARQRVAGNGTESRFSVHLEQPALRNQKTHNRTKQNYDKHNPHEFTTHANEPAGLAGRLDNPTLTLTYIKDDPANSLVVSAPGGTTAVDDIIVDNLPGFGTDNTDSPVIYYDMQGRRVDNPSYGLYVRRQGTRAEKVIIR